MTIRKILYKRINREETFKGFATNNNGDEIYFTMVGNNIVCHDNKGLILSVPELEKEIGKLNLVKAS